MRKKVFLPVAGAVLILMMLLPQDAISQLGNALFIWGRPIAPTQPTNGQALVWSDSNNRWQPGAGTGTGCVTAGSAGQLVYDDGAGGCNSAADFVYTTHTLASGAAGILDLHLAAASALKVPGAFATGVIHVTTTTGATLGGLIVNADITNGTIAAAKLIGTDIATVGTITTGTWTGTTIAVANGGTGATAKQAAFDALAPTATRAGDVTYWNGTHYVNLAGNNSGTACLQENSSGVPSFASCGSGSGNVTTGDTLTDGLPILGADTTAVKIGAWGAGLGVVGVTVTLDPGVVNLIASNQSISGVKTFAANKLILTPGADSGSTAGMVNIDASGNLDWYSSGRIYAMRNPGTTAADIFYCSATTTPCVPARLAASATPDTFLRNNADGTLSWNLVSFANLNGSAVSSQIPAVPLTAGTSVTLSENNRYFVCTGTCTVTVPVPAAGVQYCVYNDNNVSTVITLSAIGSSARYENTDRTAYGTAGTGTFVSGGAVKDSACIVGRDATHYSTLSFNGTWTAN